MKIVTILLFGLITQTAISQCNGTEPAFNFATDTVLCTGQSLTLSVPNGYDFYHWSNGQQGTSITVNSNGIYGVEAGIIGSNLILNGDFQGGTTNTANNFTTDYTPGTGGSWGTLSNGGTYAISTSPHLTHTNFVVCGDHTTGSGNMLVANGAWTLNTIVWSQTVPVNANQDYIFNFWETNVVNNPNVAQLQLFINNTPVTDIISTSVPSCQWNQISGTWNAGSSTQAVLKIINQSTVASGNDFAIDDVFFAPICLKKDSIIVAVENAQVDAGPNLTFCANETGNTMATSNVAMDSFTWSDGTVGPTLNPTSSGWYKVNALSANGCTAKDSLLVTIKEMNWNIDTIIMQPTSCGNSDGYITALTNGTFNSPPNYTWSGPGVGNPNSISASVWTDLGAGWYYLAIQSDGCYRYDSVEVTISNPPVAAFSANPTSGYAPLVVTIDNNSSGANTFLWDFGNGNTAQSNTNTSQTQQYDSVGVYQMAIIAQNGNCTDTFYITIEVVEKPIVIEEPVGPSSLTTANVFSPNGDGSNDLFTFRMENITELEVFVFNRWGSKVYESSSANTFLWDGKDSGGELLTEGIYFYTFTAKGIDGINYNGNGFIHLIK